MWCARLYFVEQVLSVCVWGNRFRNLHQGWYLWIRCLQELLHADLVLCVKKLLFDTQRQTVTTFRTVRGSVRHKSHLCAARSRFVFCRIFVYCQDEISGGRGQVRKTHNLGLQVWILIWAVIAPPSAPPPPPPATPRPPCPSGKTSRPPPPLSTHPFLSVQGSGFSVCVFGSDDTPEFQKLAHGQKRFYGSRKKGDLGRNQYNYAKSTSIRHCLTR